MALSAPKTITQKHGVNWMTDVPLLTNKIIYHGAMIAKVTASGYAQPAAAASGQKVLGVADLQAWSDKNDQGVASTYGRTDYSKIDMTGVASGTRKIMVRQGTFVFKNKAGDLVTNLMIGDDVYVEDDETVRATSTSSIVAGTLVGFDPLTGNPEVKIGSFAEAV